MTNFKKYRHRESGEIVEAKILDLIIADYESVLGTTYLNMGNHGSHYFIKGGSAFWTYDTFSSLYKEVKENE